MFVPKTQMLHECVYAFVRAGAALRVILRVTAQTEGGNTASPCWQSQWADTESLFEDIKSSYKWTLGMTRKKRKWKEESESLNKGW